MQRTFSFLALLLFLAAPFLAASTAPQSGGVSAVAGLAGNLPGGSSLASNLDACTATGLDVVNAAFEQAVVELLNQQRDQYGLPPLGRSSELDAAARYHATDMAQDTYFNHDSYDRVNNTLTWVCGWSERIANYYQYWTWLGENIAFTQTSPEAVFTAWMLSDGHRANMLNSSFWEIGSGYATGNYWALDFGRRYGRYPLVINLEAARTSDPTVDLYLYGSFSEMRLRNDDGEWSAWVPFSNRSTWVLPETAGEHTVSVEMRSGSWLATSSDSITLEAAGAPLLGALPETVRFVYSTVEGKSLPEVLTFQPLNTGEGGSLDWQLVTSGDWFSVTPSSGSTPETFTITPLAGLNLPAGEYAGSVTLTVVQPLSVSGSPDTINLVLQVIDQPFSHLYVPYLGG